MRYLVTVVFVLSVACCAVARSTVDRTIARLNEDILTESDLGRSMSEHPAASAMHAGALDNATSTQLGALFDRTLLLQAAKQRSIQPPEAEIQQQVETLLADIRAGYPSEAVFRQELANEQLTVEELKKQLLKRAKTDYQIFQLVNSRFTITEADARRFEAECAARGESAVSLHLRRLAVPVNGNAAKAREKVRELASRIFTEGLSFEDGIRKYSQAPGAKEDGGDLGYLPPEKLSSEVVQATRDLQVGQASVPVVAGGYANIFYVEAKHGARSLLLERKFTENREALLKELRRKANLQILDRRVENILPDEYRAAARRALATNAYSTTATEPLQTRKRM